MSWRKRRSTPLSRLPRSLLTTAILRLIVLMLFAGRLAAADTPGHCQHPQYAESLTMSVGVAPWTNSQIAKFWSGQLGKHFRSGYCIAATFRSDADYLAYLHAAVSGKYDLLDAPPHIALFLVQHHGFQIVARERFNTARTTYFVRSDSKIMSLADLGSKVLAAPDPLGFVSLVAVERFAGRMPPTTITYFGKHEQVISAVLNKQASAGVIYSPMLDSYRERHEDRFRILHSEPNRVDGFMVARKNIAAQLLSRSRIALLQFNAQHSALLQRWEPVATPELEPLLSEYAPYIAAVHRRWSNSASLAPALQPASDQQ